MSEPDFIDQFGPMEVAAPFLLFTALFLCLWLVLYFVLPLVWGLVERLGQAVARMSLGNQRIRAWIERRREQWADWHVYLPAVLITAAGVAATIWTGDLFLDLAELLREKSPLLSQVDDAVYSLAHGYRLRPFTLFFIGAAEIGGPIGLGIIVLIVSALLVRKRLYRWLAYLIFTTGLGGLLNLLLKAYFARQRPELANALRHASGYSFPSGHAMGSIIVFSALAYLAVRAFTRWRSISLAVAFAISAVLAICASRIYLGVHWISDIGAGLSAGAVWVTWTTAAYEVIGQTRRVGMRSRGEAVHDTAKV